MRDALAVTELGMLNDVQRLNSISHNVANAGTVGFKREVVTIQPFVEHLAQANDANDSTMPTQTSPSTSIHIDHKAGTLKYTGNPLDVALEGDGLFAVSTPMGEAYTRQGNFHVDANGRLVTAAGYVVMGEGGDISVTVPDPRIDAQGRVWEGATQVGQLKIVSTNDMTTLTRAGEGLFLAGEGTNMSDASGVNARQGFAEMSNVVAMNEMIKMIETVRHFEASQRLLRGYDAMMDRAINAGGEV
ncbi:MAG: flagellar basal-body rod protein FlgF [Gammaproteobacteria bacterium]|nr:flagellar basal-body rod protein FlgF [Gammaproteobacteria bacterium]